MFRLSFRSVPPNDLSRSHFPSQVSRNRILCDFTILPLPPKFLRNSITPQRFKASVEPLYQSHDHFTKHAFSWIKSSNNPFPMVISLIFSIIIRIIHRHSCHYIIYQRLHPGLSYNYLKLNISLLYNLSD